VMLQSALVVVINPIVLIRFAVQISSYQSARIVLQVFSVTPSRSCYRNW
jgi:hypothetical protein